jgi:MFS family permease
MDFIRKNSVRTSNSFGLLYVINFIVSFHLFFIVYFNSNFLNSEGFSDQSVSLIYIFGSILSIIGLFLMPRILRRFGNYSTVLTIIALELVAFLTLAFIGNITITTIAFLGYLLFYPLILISFDIFLEGIIENESTTGTIRGTFLTITNTALIIAPFTAGLLLNGDGFRHMYLIAGALLILPLIIISLYFRKFSDPEYELIDYKKTIKEFKQEKNLRNIFVSHFTLRLFFSFMVIYTPLYLHNTIGFTFSEIGVLFAIMLLPFALFEIPLGKIADRWLGEKEILIAGLLITGFSTIAISFVTTSSFVLWAVLLFTTRVGASAIEIMTESHFFKHVAGVDANTISLFRMLRPLGYIVGPVLGAIILSFVNIQFIFIVPGLIVLSGIIFASQIKDTK